MLLYAIDPGTTASALVVYDALIKRVTRHLYGENLIILQALQHRHPADAGAVLLVEQIEAMGMSVGAEVFETVWWAGRFHQAWPSGVAHRVTRRQVKLHLCQNMRAKDTNIRTALLDKFGPGKALAVGTKPKPGPLYGLKAHGYAALAIAVTWAETQCITPSTLEEPI